MSRRALWALIVLLLIVLAMVAVIFAAIVIHAQDHKATPARPVLSMTDHGYTFDAEQDLQLPELPTGCEATALSTLLRINGYEVTKTEVADAMPKSDSDFVFSFWGDPYSEHGGACMSPCAAATANIFTGDGVDGLASAVEGLDLADVPWPACVWVTIDLQEPEPLRTQGAYTMSKYSHCMTVLGITDEIVMVIDPLQGPMTYPRAIFEDRYNALGKQAVFLNHYNYIEELIP